MESALLASSTMKWKQGGRFGTKNLWRAINAVNRALNGIRNRSGGCGVRFLPQHFFGSPPQLRDPIEVGNVAGQRFPELAHDERVQGLAPVDLGPEDVEPVIRPRRVAASSPALDLIERGEQSVSDLPEILEKRTGLTEGLRRVCVAADREHQ